MKSKNTRRNTTEESGQNKKRVSDRELNSRPIQSPKERLEKKELDYNPNGVEEADAEIYLRQISELAYHLYLKRSKNNGNA
jgi:hypothetical protein